MSMTAHVSAPSLIEARGFVADVQRRIGARTFENLRQAITFVDHALLFDNSPSDEPYRFIAEFAGAKVVRQGSYRCAWGRTFS